jgi:hypothetical protein
MKSLKRARECLPLCYRPWLQIPPSRDRWLHRLLKKASKSGLRETVLFRAPGLRSRHGFCLTLTLFVGCDHSAILRQWYLDDKSCCVMDPETGLVTRQPITTQPLSLPRAPCTHPGSAELMPVEPAGPDEVLTDGLHQSCLPVYNLALDVTLALKVP